MSSRIIKAGAVLAGGAVLVIFTAFVFQGDEQLQFQAAKRSFEFAYNVSVKDVPAKAKEVKVWVPVPASNNCQQLHFVRVDSDWPYETVTDSKYGNGYMVFDVSGDESDTDSERQIAIVFGLTRFESRPLQCDADFEELSSEEIQLHLAPHRLVPIDGVIAEEARQVTGKVKKKFDLSKRIYDHIVDTLSYDKRGSGWGRGDALYACDVRKGNCTDFHSLFIAELRSLGIPARFVMGFGIPEKSEGQIEGYHCWAEFYIDGKGWLPVDASEASKEPSRREELFAAVDENRVAFTIGRDIKLPGSSGEEVNYSIYPNVEIDDQLYTNVDASFNYKNAEMTQNTISAMLDKKINF